MSSQTLPDLRPTAGKLKTTTELEPLPGDLSFDLDIAIDTKAQSAKPMITSHFICTPGCTSPGGGSFCSFCC